jgi:hypothetical protein
MKALLAAIAASFFLTGCVSMVVGAAVTAVDVTIGAVKLTGKAVGAAADLVIPDSKKEEK